jgi:hypothetical protein
MSLPSYVQSELFFLRGFKMKYFVLVLMAFAMMVPEVSFAGCGSHGSRCGSHRPCGSSRPCRSQGPCGSHGGPCGGSFGSIGPRPLIIGGGAVAFRRSRRLARRANRAAFFGFFGRANRLAFRSNAAFNRGLFRNARFNGF